MIVFDLQCANGHRFEGWFEDSLAYQDQKERSLISCPVCNNNSVSKIPSTFAIKSSSGINKPSLVREDIEKIGSKIADFMDKNFDNVGCDFAKEALKIHYGASEPRNIRGVSTPEEEKTLKQEGVQFFKFPSSSSQSDTDPSDTDNFQ
ncbi:DUF1178 [Desulfonema limicola]|uniref:DUF1178 n=1 Tax=Desulfonema limicola TaxID=45656 RepID=A0A975B3N4_9BACT|nr:DUF1178 family protein [Desulfonema limicola]QTA78181.1 DUF1178 [Desulfonema limicola]